MGLGNVRYSRLQRTRLSSHPAQLPVFRRPATLRPHSILPTILALSQMLLIQEAFYEQYAVQRVVIPSRCPCRLLLAQREAAQIIGRCLRLVACREKGAAVSLQEPNPRLDIAGVPQVTVNRELSTKEGRA